jgi:predicted transcriptional regulator
MERLTAKEEELMRFFWKNDALFVKELLDFYDEPKPHFNTLSTIVRGLEEKGFLAHKTYGNTYQYYAVISEDEYGHGTLQKAISKYFDNSCLRAVSALVRNEKITIEELKNLIQEVEQNNQK